MKGQELVKGAGMTESLFEPIEDEDFLPGAHNPCALVHNPFEWNGTDETVDAE